MSEQADTATVDTTDTDTSSTTETVTEETDMVAEAEKWKAMARKHERAAKQAAKELDEARRSAMSADERAIDEARAAGRAEAKAELAVDRAADAVRAAAAGRNVDVEALLEGVDPSKFITDGSPDRKAIAEWLDRIAPVAATQQQQPMTQLAQGPMTSLTTPLNGDPLEQALRQKLGI